MTDIFDDMVKAWPAPVVSRNDVAAFSGGLLHPRTLANADSLGRGPSRIYYGRKVAYSTKELAAWMRSKAHAENGMQEEHND